MYKRRGALPPFVHPRTLRVNENMSGVPLSWKYAQNVASNLCSQRAPTLFQKRLGAKELLLRRRRAGPPRRFQLERVEKNEISLSDLMDGVLMGLGGGAGIVLRSGARPERTPRGRASIQSFVLN